LARILRGDIRWAELDPAVGHEQAGRRPVLVLSVGPFNERSSTVIAMAITSRPQRAGFPFTMPLRSKTLRRQSWVKIGQVRTLSATRLGPRLGHAARDELTWAILGLRRILGD
jgi:mRNA interferase MazF